MTIADFLPLELALPVGRKQGTSVRALGARLTWSERKVRQGMQILRRRRHLAIAGLPERERASSSPPAKTSRLSSARATACAPGP